MKTNTESKKTALMGLMVFFIMLNVLSGCASHSKTVETTVTDPQTQTVTTTETTRSESASEERGVLGSTFHVLGEIIAFPFEVIANVFRFIF